MYNFRAIDSTTSSPTDLVKRRKSMQFDAVDPRSQTKVYCGNLEISVYDGDITKVKCDAVINPASARISSGGQ